MELMVGRTPALQGSIAVPASKSHTIRAVFIASLASGTSRLTTPLQSEDTRAAIQACTALGARIDQQGKVLSVTGFGSGPRQPDHVLDMLNSGTSTNLLLGVLAALGLTAQVSGDSSLKSRPLGALTSALVQAGCRIEFLGRPGCPPLKISGKMTGREICIDAGQSSQYVSSLLLVCPLLDHDTHLKVLNPTELPYIEMTLGWLDRQNIRYERDGFTCFKIPGRQSYSPFESVIPADWSSATFPLCAAAITRSDVTIKGVDLHDVQGDKAVVGYLQQMGADIRVEEGAVRVRGGALSGRELDINATPDALPALSVVGCCARGTTRLCNVAQARVKETDRIRVMAAELTKLGAAVEELPDGLRISQSSLSGAPVCGHHDHRVVMALSLAGMLASGTTIIDTAEAVSVTYPDYVSTLHQLGANFKIR